MDGRRPVGASSSRSSGGSLGGIPIGGAAAGLFGQGYPLNGANHFGQDSSSGSNSAGGWGLKGSVRSSALSGLRERVRSSFGVEKNGRSRQRWIAKATDAEREALKPEDWRKVVAEVWEAAESRWVLQRVRERPVAADHVVAFKALQLLHRVLQHGPPEVVSDWSHPNPVIDGLATHWGANARGARVTQPQHCMQAVAEYARVISAKMELMVGGEAGKMNFHGNLVCDPLPVEASDLLQALAILLNFAEKLMPLALHLVAPTVDVWRLERSQYIRLYLGAIAALLDESWLLLCAISNFVKDLLVQVHAARQHSPAPPPGDDSRHRPPWLELSLHLHTAKPRFAWFHASVCDFVAHCHQLRCAGFSELETSIPNVPQGLMNLFADLDALVQGCQPVDPKKGQRREQSISSMSTAAGSTPAPSDGSGSGSQQHSIGSARQPAAQRGRLPHQHPHPQQALEQSQQQPHSQMQPQQPQQVCTWEPSPCVLDALRTVDSLQRVPRFTDMGDMSTARDATLFGASAARTASQEGETVADGGRNRSAPAPSRQRSADGALSPSADRPWAMRRSKTQGCPEAAVDSRGYELLEEDETSRSASAEPSSESRQAGRPLMGPAVVPVEAEANVVDETTSSSLRRRSGSSGTGREASALPIAPSVPAAQATLWQPADSAEPLLDGSSTASGRPVDASASSPSDRAWPPLQPRATPVVEAPAPWPADGFGGMSGGSQALPSWAAAICQSNTLRGDGSAIAGAPAQQPLFGMPLWQTPDSDSQAQRAAAQQNHSPKQSQHQQHHHQPPQQVPPAAAPQQQQAQQQAQQQPQQQTQQQPQHQFHQQQQQQGAVQQPRPWRLDWRVEMTGGNAVASCGGSEAAANGIGAASGASRNSPCGAPPHPQEKRPEPTTQQAAVAAIPLNPFDLTATQLQRTMRRGDPWEDRGGRDVSPPAATVQCREGGSPTPRRAETPPDVSAAPARSPAMRPPARLPSPAAAVPRPAAGGGASPSGAAAIAQQRFGGVLASFGVVGGAGRVGSPQRHLQPQQLNQQHQPHTPHQRQQRQQQRQQQQLPRRETSYPNQQLVQQQPKQPSKQTQYQQSPDQQPPRPLPLQPRQRPAGKDATPLQPLHEHCEDRGAGTGAPVGVGAVGQAGGVSLGGGVVGADWEVDPNELRLEEMLGTGSTAEVFRGSWHGTDVAVKRLRKSGPLPVEFTREIAVLLRLRHPNLVLFMGACTQAAPPLIISEFCAGGTVFNILHQRKEMALPWPQRLKIAVDVAKGMNFLHRRQVVHRDLKSLNLLLASPIVSDDDVPQVKVSDFGLSRAWPASEQSKAQACMTSGAGTYHWMAPEVLDGHTYDEKVDVYSYGICLYELIARRIPYDTSGLEPVSIAVAVSKGRRPELACLPRDCPADLRFTMECCWAHCPTGRPGFDTILETLKLVNCL